MWLELELNVGVGEWREKIEAENVGVEKTC
jgi:hypothetical protein